MTLRCSAVVLNVLAIGGITIEAARVGQLTKTQSCPYTSLLHSNAEEHSGGVLLHNVCGTDVQLFKWAGANDMAFADVDWLKRDDSPWTQDNQQYIDNYTGSFKWARNVEAQVLRGMTPFTTQEDAVSMEGGNAWNSRGLADLTTEVLAWTVGFGAALNKIADTSKPLTLWRGQWELASTVSRLEKKPRNFGFPWFQSTTTNYDHCTIFFRSIYQPWRCTRRRCIDSGEAFPVLYEFSTTRGKDLRRWNPAEDEFVLLPNAKMDVLSFEKVWNDQFLGFDSKGLGAWFRQSHKALGRDEMVGPFDQVAKAVEDKGTSGADFLRLYNSGDVWDQKWIRELGLSYSASLKDGMYKVLKTRFLLPPNGKEPNDLPFYYKVVAKDAD